MWKKTTLFMMLFVLLAATQISCRKHKLTQQEKKLFEQINAGNIAEIARLIEAGTNIRVKDQHGNTPLFRAAMAGNKSAAEVLLDNGAYINMRNDANETPLHFAVKSNNMATISSLENRVGLIKLFLEHGADVNALDKRLHTPLHISIAWGWFKNSPSNTPESKVAHKEIIEAFLKKGADPNLKDRSGRTPLKLAEGEPEIIELLIKYGAKN